MNKMLFICYRMMLKPWLLLGFIFFFGPGFAQKNLIRFQNLTIDNGLAQGSVTGIVHGKNGYIWIATAEGLHRYDGYNFKVYRNIPGDKTSLPDNYISCLFEDSKGNLLIGLYSGEVCILNKNTSQFQKLNIASGKNIETSSPVTCINQDEEGHYLIGFEGAGMIRYDSAKHKSKIFKHELSPGLGNNILKCIVKDPYTGNFWVGTALGVYEYNARNQSFSQLSTLKNIENVPVTAVLTPEPQLLYFGTHGKGLYHFVRGSDSATRLVLPKSKGTRFISFLQQSPQTGEIWIGTSGGIIKYQSGESTLYMNDALNPESLVDNNTQTALIDKFGTLWVGTINGLSRFDKRLKLFNLFREFHWKDTLLNNNVYCIYQDPDQQIWMGTLSSGLIKFNPATEQINAWPLIKSKGLETKMVRAILKDKNGQMWVGTRDKGLFKFFPETGRFEQVIGSGGKLLSSPTIRHLHEDSQGMLWIGTANGLNAYNRTTNTFEVFRAIKESPNNNSIYQILESKDKKSLYLASFRGGFQIFDKATETFRLFNTGYMAKNNIGRSYAMCFEMLSDDSVMVGTYGGGLCIINIKTGKYRSITEKEGLPNNSVYGILRDGYNFWLSTNRGLARYNLKNHQILSFGLKNYIQSNEYNEGGYCKTSDGTFYFGGVNGFNYFKPSEVNTTFSPSKIEITAIKKGEIEIPFAMSEKGEKFVNLHYNDNLISFEFANLNFLSGNSNQYTYKLEGFDDNWIKAGNRTIAYYTKLSPGHYTFRVKGLSADSGIAQIETFIKIIIDPPFWRTWWFYLLMLLVCLAIIYYFIRWRTQIIDQNYKHKLAEMELKALRSQMNPHFIFNSLNSIQYFILKKEPKAAYNYLTKFSTLMRMILQNSKHKSISLKSEHDWLQTYLELENLRMENTLNFKIEIDAKINPEKVFVPTMVLQPYVENAIIHGLLPKEGHRELSIEILLEGQKIKCIIYDNGIGRKKSAEINNLRLKNHESTAMNLTKDRLAILNINHMEGIGPVVIDIEDENEQSLGTKVELLLPLIIQNESLNL